MNKLRDLSSGELAKILWDYHFLDHKIEKADLIMVLGTYDLRVPEYGADLYKKGYAPLIMVCGKRGRLTEELASTEAEIFAEIAIKNGVPKDDILIEKESTNTGENVKFAREILNHKQLNVKKIIVVQKPYMQRRIYATFKKQWPEVELIVTSPPISFEEFPAHGVDKETFINDMVADLQRIIIYPEKGFQIFQEIPVDVQSAYQELIKRGYNKSII